jgi:hypothetical protein
MFNAKTATSALLLAFPWFSGCQSPGPKACPSQEMMDLPLVFDDDFESPAGDRWEPTDPDAWRYTHDGERGVYSLYQPSKYRAKHRSPYGIAWRKGIYISDFVMDVWLRSTKEDYGHRDLCLFFGSQTPVRFYYVHLGLKSDDHSNTVMIVNDAPRTGIVDYRSDGTPWEERYHHVRIVRKVHPGTIEVYFDDMDRPIMAAMDMTFRWGRVGIGSFDDVGNFDRVSLWGRTVEPPAGSQPCGADSQ